LGVGATELVGVAAEEAGKEELAVGRMRIDGMFLQKTLDK